MISSGTMLPPVLRGASEAFTVLFCGHEFEVGWRATVESLASSGSTVQVSSDSHHSKVPRCQHHQLPSFIGLADVLVPLGAWLTRDLLVSAKRCKLILQFGVGVEKIDVLAANELGIPVSNMPSHLTGNALSCAELAIYLMLTTLRRAHETQDAFMAGRVGFPTGQTLYGKTCLVLGFGNIAKELVPRLKAFGVRVIAVRQSQWGSSPVEDQLDLKGSWQDRFKFAGQADIVALACSQCQATMRLVNTDFLGACKPGVTIINVARGGLLDYDAVKQGLVDGRIGALGLDVQWQEPFNPHDFIAKHPAVYLTPHIAGVTTLAVSSMAKTLAEEVQRCMAGLGPTILVNDIKSQNDKLNEGAVIQIAAQSSLAMADGGTALPLDRITLAAMETS